MKKKFLGMGLTGLLLCGAGTADAVLFDVELLDLSLTGQYSIGKALNDSGQITGHAVSSNNTDHAFFSDGNNTTDLGTLGGLTSYGYGINNSGQVTGNSRTADGSTHAFIYENGHMTDLGTLGGTYSGANGINNSGQVTGGSNSLGSSAIHAFIYENGHMTDLATLGGQSSSGYGINNNGQVTGYSFTSNNQQHAFLYDNGSMTDLGVLSGTSSYGYGINDNGLVVGRSSISSSYSSSTFHAFLYDGSMIDLGSFGGDSLALNINNSGQVVGWADDATSGERHAFLWDDINGMVTLDDYLSSSLEVNEFLSYSLDINDNGQILASSNLGNHYLLTEQQSGPTPTPEPATILLFGTGLAGLAGTQVRKRKEQ